MRSIDWIKCWKGVREGTHKQTDRQTDRQTGSNVDYNGSLPIHATYRTKRGSLE